MTRKLLSLAAILGASALTLAGCAGSPESSGASDTSGTTLTLRMWDETVAKSYEKSISAFEAENPEINVDINIVPWTDYWTKLRQDVATKKADDLFMVNASSYSAYVDSGNLLDIGTTLGVNAKNAWEPSVVDQYTRNDKLWAVPQLYDAGIAVYYNADLLAAAEVNPEELNDLTWSPDVEKDTYLPLAKKLTRDAAGVPVDVEGFDGTPVQYGTSLSNDGQAIILPFTGSNGGTFQDGDDFNFANAQTTESVKYLVDAINTSKVAPPAAETNASGDYARDAFLEGRLATFQSGVYNLKNVSEGAAFKWGVAMLPAGPEGRVSVTNGVALAGNANADKDSQPAIKKLLAWFGSTEGATFIGAEGSHIPAVTEAQKSFFDYWKKENVDVDPFFDVIKDNKTIPAFTGPKFESGAAAYKPIFDQIFAGQIEVRDGLKKAQDAGNAALAG
ncbi:ABC transporter substrate-binding protein [Mycetocola spongiae]|uniref:ABC transporter substrate-binding protein n=1 Tax=Mycetocola spongiae TaxID=2859226 RepID=UPI001CF5DA95|nr:sugar ABC transporter substrate-binding protein [Mycetocola spongiae]UCR88282.1 sugar ABC transporter substrate-binding protein [Mycetocola spongiae]